jgi:DNA-binding transcriptional ArsR family regulator
MASFPFNRKNDVLKADCVWLKFYHHLAHKIRHRLIVELSQQAYSTKQLQSHLRVDESVLCHHLAKLKQFNLVLEQQEGNTQRYQLNTARLESLIREILNQEKSIKHNLDEEKFKKLQSWCQELSTPKQRKALLKKIHKQEEEHRRMLASFMLDEEDFD